MRSAGSSEPRQTLRAIQGAEARLELGAEHAWPQAPGTKWHERGLAATWLRSQTTAQHPWGRALPWRQNRECRVTQPYGAGAELEVCTYLCIYKASKFQHASASLGENAIEKGVQDTAFLPQFPSGTTDFTFPCLICFGYL